MDFAGQAKVFIAIVATGALLGGLFDMYRAVRRVAHLRWLAAAGADLLYWLLALIVALAALVLINWGEVRFYVFVCLAIGALTYFRLASRWIFPLWLFFFQRLANVIRQVRLILLYALVKPVRRGRRLIHVFYGKLRRIIPFPTKK